jgi:Tn3 transposase DDE domain
LIFREPIFGFCLQKGNFATEPYELLPDGYIQIPLIAPQWDEMLRFIATIKLKEATASQLFRRLNSYSKHHPLYHALKEFGKIPKSDFRRFLKKNFLIQDVGTGLIKMSYLGNAGCRSNRASTACIAALPSVMPFW